MTAPQEPVYTEEQLDEILAEKRGSNKVIFDEIRAAGQQLDAAALALIRIDTLVKALLTPIDQKRFEIQFESRITSALNDAASQIRQARLATGPIPTQQQLKNGLILPSGVH